MLAKALLTTPTYYPTHEKNLLLEAARFKYGDVATTLNPDEGSLPELHDNQTHRHYRGTRSLSDHLSINLQLLSHEI